MHLTEKEIEVELNKEIEKFLNSKYSGKIKIPENILLLLEHGVKALPPSVHKVNYYFIKNVLNSPYTELTNSDLKFIIPIIENTPFEKLYPLMEFDLAILSHIKFDKFIMGYNNEIKEFEEMLRMKKANLLSLNNGLKINGLTIAARN